MAKKIPDATRAKAALAAYWSSRGDDGYAEAAEECRSLSRDQLVLLEAWLPSGSPGSSTAIKCDRARTLVRGIINEK